MRLTSIAGSDSFRSSANYPYLCRHDSRLPIFPTVGDVFSTCLSLQLYRGKTANNSMPRQLWQDVRKLAGAPAVNPPHLILASLNCTFQPIVDDVYLSSDPGSVYLLQDSVRPIPADRGQRRHWGTCGWAPIYGEHPNGAGHHRIQHRRLHGPDRATLRAGQKKGRDNTAYSTSRVLDRLGDTRASRHDRAMARAIKNNDMIKNPSVLFVENVQKT